MTALTATIKLLAFTCLFVLALLQDNPSTFPVKNSAACHSYNDHFLLTKCDKLQKIWCETNP